MHGLISGSARPAAFFCVHFHLSLNFPFVFRLDLNLRL